jgi:hypothetical protein
VQEHCPERLPEINTEDYENTALGRAYEFISDWSGIHNLVMQDCFNIPKGHSVPPKWFASMCDDCIQPEDLETVDVLAACLVEEVKFAWCPTQKHMDYMKNLGRHGRDGPQLGGLWREIELCGQYDASSMILSTSSVESLDCKCCFTAMTSPTDG